jgi:branched-chain amino acid transport system permease protein
MKRWQIAVAVAGFAAALAVPAVITQDYLLQIFFRIALFAALGLAWNLVGGYAGQLSLGHAAYFGVGAYGLAILHRHGVNMWLAGIIAIVLAVLSAVLIGSASFRLRGPYFCLATIAFAEVMRITAKNLDRLTGGDVGIEVPLLFPRNSTAWFCISAILLTAISFLLTIWISKSKFGYYLMAVREDQDTAASVGVNTARTKLYALLVSAALTAIGGVLYGSLFLYIVPDQVLTVELSVEISVVAMLGGAGTALGPIVGSVILESAAELFKTQFKEAHLMVYGILIVVVVLFLPEGVVGTISNRVRIWKHAPTAPFSARGRAAAKETARAGTIVK